MKILPDDLWDDPADACETCIWSMSGPWVKSRGGKSSEIWCGAGWDGYFHARGGCPGRIAKICVEFNVDQYDWLAGYGDTGANVINSEVFDWMRDHQPTTTIIPNWDEDAILVAFVSEKDVIEFALRWA